MCERIKAILRWRAVYRKEWKVRKKYDKLEKQLRRLRDFRAALTELRNNADYEAACLLREHGPVELDGKRYAARLADDYGVWYPTLQIDPLPEALAVGAHNAPGVVP